MAQTMERVKVEDGLRPSAYPTLLVHAEPGLASSHRVEVAVRLAHDLDAHLIGLGAETFDPIPTPDPFSGYAAGEWVGLMRDQISGRLADAEAAFRRDAEGADCEWRTLQDYPGLAIARCARMADLIVMSPKGESGPTRCADPADVVMNAGRPVLMAPENHHRLHGKCVVIAWKDTRECRRAVSDAMPFLQRADDVIVQSVCAPDDADAMVFEIDDVASNLKRHGVAARANISTVGPDGVTPALMRVVEASGADLIVAGAYGHSRAREWAFGGVTDDLLRRPGCFVLLSH